MNFWNFLAEAVCVLVAVASGYCVYIMCPGLQGLAND